MDSDLNYTGTFVLNANCLKRLDEANKIGLLSHFCTPCAYRVIEELQGINWMPLDESKSFSLLEFKKVLMTKNNECFLTLQRLSKYQAALMNSVCLCLTKTSKKDAVFGSAKVLLLLY